MGARRIKKWLKENWWFIVTVGVCLFWVSAIAMLFWLFPLETKAEDYGMTREELEEESYDSLELLEVQMELESRTYPGLYYFTTNTWPEHGTP